MTKLRPPVKIHGGKHYQTGWIVGMFPHDYTDRIYCELCCGGANVFLNKVRSNQEVINDKDSKLICIYRSLRDEPEEFINRIRKIPYTQDSFRDALDQSCETFKDYVDQAVNEYVLRRMSRNGMKQAFSWSERTRNGRPGDLNAWETMIRQLPLLSERIRGTVILNESLKDIAKIWDDDKALVYLDPPYLPETRTAPNVYDNEMTVEDHIDLLNYAKDARSKVIISGYASPLYNKYLKDWRVETKDMPNHSAQTSTKGRRVEVVWLNY